MPTPDEKHIKRINYEKILDKVKLLFKRGIMAIYFFMLTVFQRFIHIKAF